MAAAVTLLAKERGGPAFRQQVLFYPVTDANFDTGSYRQFATGYFLRRDAMQWFWDQYTTDPAQRAEIHRLPLRASLEQLTGLPPALVITAEADVLRDEGEAYADSSATLASLSPPTATRASSTTSSCSTPSRHQRRRGAIALATATLRNSLSDKPWGSHLARAIRLWTTPDTTGRQMPCHAYAGLRW